MILVENSSFASSPESDFAATHQNPFVDFDSPNPRDPFLELEEIDQLLFREPEESKGATVGEYFCGDLAEEEDFLEIDLSDASSEDSDDLSSLTPSVQRLFCQTSMSNYSSSSSVISSLVDDVGARLNDSRRASILSKPSIFNNKSSYLFDNTSSSGSGSSASSTPSTPSSTTGTFISSLSHPAAASSTTSTLPSFSEIYSPRGKGSTRNPFDYNGDFFKFEDYISEGDSVSGDENSTALLATAIQAPLPASGQLATNGASFSALHPQIILKEEPMDSFIPTTTPIEASAMQLKQSVAKYSDAFGHLAGLQSKQGTFEVTKVEPDNKEELIFRAGSPKPMRYHLHNLSLNVMAAAGQHGEAAPFEDTFETMESESMERLTANTTPFEQATSQHSGMPPHLMPGNSMMASTGLDNTVMDVAGGGHVYRGGKVRNQRSKSVQMQICAVCGDVAACQHYGVLTCEGCKGFFKRTVQKGSKYTCLGNKDCTVDKRRRNRCQFCRFQKCLAVGMVKEVVRTDSLKGRRGRLPSKPKLSQETPHFPPMSTISALVKAHMETTTDRANLDFSQYSDTVAPETRELIDAQMLTMLNTSLNNLYTFMEKIPGFSELSEHDRRVLYQSSCLELFALRMAYRIKPGSNYFILCNNIVMHRNQFSASFGEWLPLIEDLSNQLHAMDIDISAFACLCGLVVTGFRPDVQDKNKIEQLETKILNSLRDHTMYNSDAQKKPNYFSRILTRLSDLRTIGVRGHCVVMERLNQYDASSATPDIRDLAKKFSANFRIPSMEMESNMQAELDCLDLPSISSFFKGWPQSMK